MSRTTFAERFRAVVGQPPLAYLAGWRMQLAADRLRSSDARVASIAYAVGYDSETAFRTAFRRQMLCTPMQYRRRMAALLLHRTLR